MEAVYPALIKIGDTFVNMNLVTHVAFAGHEATVYLACQVTDLEGKNGTQSNLTFDADEAHELLWHLHQRASVKPA
jgi:hypothetical protein